MPALLLLLALLGLAGRAAAAQPAMRLDPGASVSTSGHMEMLRDPAGRLHADAAMAEPAWQALPGSVDVGYTRDVLWLRLSVRRGAQTPDHWLLAFSNALLDDVRLYQRDAGGNWRQMARSGDGLPRALWPIDARNPVLPLWLDGDADQELLLRLQARNAMVTRIEIATPQRQGAESRRENFYYGLGFGFGLLLVMFHLLFWRKSRDAASGWYVAHVGCVLAAEWLSSGLLQQMLELPGRFADPLLGMVLCSALPITVIFGAQQMGMDERLPRLRRALVGAAIAVGGLACLLTLARGLDVGMPPMQLGALAAMAVMVGSALWLLPRDDGRARAFLLIFGIYYGGVLIAFLRNLGVVPSTEVTQNAAALGALVHMVAMSVRLSQGYERLRREKDAAQAHVVQLIGRQNERLEQEVRRRTADLRQEIARRECLEMELRAALAAERSAKQSQLDFVAMVSHEFRTPLAIINTTAQQIARNLDAAHERTLARCANLRSAAQRMVALVDEYLSMDRMDAEQSPFQPRECAGEELHELLDDLVADWPDGRVLLREERLPRRLRCDISLLRVALRNLLANADRHAAAGLPLELEVKARAGRLILRVSNPGQAVPADEVPRLFEKFFRGRQAQQSPGAGLGLYLVRRIAELHGGQAALESPGGDTPVRFRLELPL